jgi:hypothetical protein
MIFAACMQKIILFFTLVFFTLAALAQPPQGGRPQQSQNGRVYGKVVDANTKESIEYAVIQIFKESDTAKAVLINGALTASNGDFDIDKIPVGEPMTMYISFVGYQPNVYPFKISPSGGMGSAGKDLGNIKMKISTELAEIVIDGSDPAYRIEFDKRVYDVDKNPANAGGTAEDVLRNVPALQVDMDGNVTMRNAAPQLFIDGRPTTLTIDQIPADAIQKVEVITNPSAKYDASGGGGGIVNIVMKHNRGLGYSGSLRVGGDSRPRFNGGADMNLREGKLNFFLNGNYNQRKSISEGTTERTSYANSPYTQLDQTQQSVNVGFFTNGKIGVDWFADNRNTFTISQSFTKGKFNPTDDINANTDTLYNTSSTNPFSTYDRHSVTDRTFQNLGSSLLYKHLFAKEGTELTSDINLNLIESVFNGIYENTYSDEAINRQKQSGSGQQQLYTSQTDFTSKLNEKTKLELGIRGSLRHYESIYNNFIYSNLTNEYIEIADLNVNYEFYDQVYAAYGTISKNAEKWKYQLGLRLESSDYLGKLQDTTLAFQISYPISAFPSLYLTRVINEKQDVQLAMSRKINRPGFMQLIPFVDYSDSLNVSRGNPELLPEFTNTLELSYQNAIDKKSTFIATAYVRYTTDLTVRNQVTEYSNVLNRNIMINTYDNASSSTAYGLELVSKSSITKWFDLTLNLNLYQSAIDGTNISASLTNSQASWWTKTNAIFKLPSNFTMQAMFDYSSRKALTVGSSDRGGGGGGGGGGFGGGGGGYGGTDNTVQGYVRPTYGLDLSVKKEFNQNKNMSLTVSMQDVLRSRIQYTHTDTDLFTQDTFRRRDWQVLRVQFSWKFGKVDSSIFKRKNMKQGGEGMEG